VKIHQTQDPNMQPLPEENEKYPQENENFLNKCYERQVSLKLFMVLAEHNKHQYRGGLRYFLPSTIWDLQIVIHTVQYVASRNQLCCRYCTMVFSTRMSQMTSSLLLT
jgi:hypothetical protein